MPTNVRNIMIKQRKNLTIKLNTKHLIYIELIFILFERFLVEIGLPGSIIYLNDIINIILIWKASHKKKIKYFNSLILIYLLICIPSLAIAIPNYSIYGGNILFSLLDLRNIVRFLIFLITCALILEESDYKNIYRILKIFFFANSLFIIYQYTFASTLGITADEMNGFFGNATGGNSFVNAIMVVVLCHAIFSWQRKETSLAELLTIIVTSIIISGLIELKAFLLEIVIIYIVYLFSKKKSTKEIILNLIILIVAILSIRQAEKIIISNAPWFKNSFNIINIIRDSSNSEGYTGSGDINRLNFISSVTKKIYNNDYLNLVFGIGFGNASTAELFGRTTDFFSKYFNLGYSNFSSSYILIESGIIGLFLYIFSFVLLAKKSYKKKKISEGFTMTIIAIFLCFYNETLKTDAGYFIYFAIASSFVNSMQQFKELK